MTTLKTLTNDQLNEVLTAVLAEIESRKAVAEIETPATEVAPAPAAKPQKTKTFRGLSKSMTSKEAHAIGATTAQYLRLSNNENVEFAPNITPAYFHYRFDIDDVEGMEAALAQGYKVIISE